MKPSPPRFKEAENLVLDFIREQAKVGSLTITKGPKGGVSRNQTLNIKHDPKCGCLTCTDSSFKEAMFRAVNDYTCSYGNDRCSKTEKSCWKCGAPIG